MASVTKKAIDGKSKSVKVLKAKKQSGPNKPRAHPPYVEMIKEAIVSLKERTGSSQYAIAKFTEEKQKDLPPNFKKLLLIQLKKLVASGKLTKVKNSFKLAAPAANSTTAVAPKKIPPATKKAVAKPKSGTTVKPKDTTPMKAKKVSVKPKKAAKTATVTSPGKKKATKAVVAKPKKKTPVKKPKSIKSPVKKRGRK